MTGHRSRRLVALTAAMVLLAGCAEGATGPEADTEREQADAEPPPTDPVTPTPEPSPTETPEPEVEAAPQPEVVVHSSQVPPLHPSVDGYPRTVVELVADDGTVHRLAVLVADTQPRRSHGLMEVPDVPAGTGMLFTFDVDRTGGFWMKGTLTDLQIAWADVGGTVVATERMSVCVADPCPSYPPGATYRSALEVRDGWLDEIGVGVGAQLRVVAPIVPAT